MTPAARRGMLILAQQALVKSSVRYDEGCALLLKVIEDWTEAEVYKKDNRSYTDEQVDALLKDRTETNAILRDEVVELRKRLCKYEGHLPITAPDGTQHCELCESEI